jgi:hypothetical protein
MIKRRKRRKRERNESLFAFPPVSSLPFSSLLFSSLLFSSLLFSSLLFLPSLECMMGLDESGNKDRGMFMFIQQRRRKCIKNETNSA